MVVDVRKLLDARPFEPFSIVTSSGTRYRVESSDHATINPHKTRVVIFFDDESHVSIAGLHIASIEQETHTS